MKVIYFLTIATNVTYFVVREIFRAIFKMFSYKSIGLLVQLFINTVLFLVAVPFFINNKTAGAPEEGFSVANSIAEAENLAAVQQILYLGNPLLLFITVVTLLVALIGAAVMHHRRKK